MKTIDVSKKKAAAAYLALGHTLKETAGKLGISIYAAWSSRVRRRYTKEECAAVKNITLYKRTLTETGRVKENQTGSPKLTKPSERRKEICHFCHRPFTAKSKFNRFCTKCNKLSPGGRLRRLARMEELSLYGRRERQKRGMVPKI